MKISEAISEINDLKPNDYSVTQKVKWLSALDGMIKREVIDRYESEDGIDYEGYTEEDTEREMIVSEPYSDIYVKWLESKIDYANGEFGKYNNSSAAFNSAYADFVKNYHRHHMPKGHNYRFY